MRKASFLSIIFLLTGTIITFAQNAQPSMADALRRDGKIYVVVLVLATIFAGIIALLMRIDRKISKLEKK